MSILGEQTCSDGTRLYLRTGIEGYDPKIPCLYAKLPFQTAIPEEFRNKRFDWSAYSAYNLQARKAAADYCKDIVSNIENGKGLWICSESSGSGKSLLASAILGYAEKNGVKETMYISVSKMEEHGKESCDSSFSAGIPLLRSSSNRRGRRRIRKILELREDAARKIGLQESYNNL